MNPPSQSGTSPGRRGIHKGARPLIMMNIEQKYQNTLNNFELADRALDEATDALRAVQHIYNKAKFKYDFMKKELRKCAENFNENK